jgi:protein gp37
MTTIIEWVKNADGSQGDTWNPIVGCSIVSPGCTNCYAMKQAHRIQAMMAGIGKKSHYAGTTKVVNGNPVWTGKLALAPDEAISAPLKRKKPTTYFANSMGDLFHENASSEWINRCFAVMEATPRHTYQILTKRPDRMLAYVKERAPLKHIWLGASVEDQHRYDERQADIAEIRRLGWTTFFSAEPLLGPIAMTGTVPDWVIAGAESGRGVARKCDLDWVRSLRDQCVELSVPFFFKQDATAKGRKIHVPELDGRVWTQMPKIGAEAA